MPELPELTVFADNLRKAVTGKKIVTATYHGQKKLNVPPEELWRALVSAQVASVERVGKQICFGISNGNTICIHLMLNGGFELASAGEVEKLPALVFSMTFADGTAVAVTDPKAWATVALNQKPDEKAVDGLSVTAEFLQSACRRQPRKLAKALLIDQAVIGGIGNAYSDEILWRAKISPKSAVGKLPAEAIEALAEAIPAVLNEAIAEIRKRRPDTVSGEIREFLKVHGAGKKTSPTGGKVIKEQIQSKTTYYTDEQKLYQ